RLVAELREQGDLQDTLIVIVGDHGEAFGQHGTVVHGIDTFDESVRVPLIFFNERLFAGTTSPEPVRLIDVAPTVLGLLGATPPPQFQGLDLSGPLRPKRAFFAAWFFDTTLGYAEAERKFIYYPEADDLLVFDLSRNP